MSEYQYYEFQAIDRPLTPQEQQAVARLSSRVEPHPRRAVFTYNWSDFPGDSSEILARYYDAMLYMANWGTKRLMFRFPRSLIDLEGAQAYCRPPYVGEYVSFSTVGEYVVLRVEFHDEDGGEWIEAEGWLDSLIPLRDDILRGDYRALYLAWLKTLEMEDLLDSVTEPPVPPGLKELSPGLQAFVDLFEVDEELTEVAAEASESRQAASDDWIRRAISQLSRDQCDTFLLRLARGESHLGVAFRKRLRKLAGTSWAEQVSQAPRRTVGYLLAETERRRELERRRQAEEAESRRIQELEALAERETETWDQVDGLIQRTKGQAYDEAVRLLLKLRELAIHRGRQLDFEGRLGEIRTQYERRSALIRRLNKAGLY